MITDEAFLEEAEAALERVENDRQLVKWHDNFFADRYMQLSHENAKKLEEMHHKKAAWFMGVGA